MNDTQPPFPHPSAGASEAVSRHGRHGSRSRSTAAYSPFAPMLILLLGMVAWSGFQLHHLRQESTSLAAARGGQDAQVQQAQRVRQVLESVANETRKLADAGNANARTVVEELRKRGVTINPATGAQPAK